MSHSTLQALRFVAQLVCLTCTGWLAGCAALSPPIVPVEGARPEDAATVARVAIDRTHPVLLRAVDGKMLPGIHVSNWLRQLTYVLHPGEHVLWVSDAPYGVAPFALIPQHIRCYVIDARLVAGAAYALRFDEEREVPVLSRPGGPGTDVEGRLVDQPLLIERGCRWR